MTILDPAGQHNVDDEFDETWLDDEEPDTELTEAAALVTAGRDVDQSSGKILVRGDFYLQTTMARTDDPTRPRRRLDSGALQQIAQTYVESDQIAALLGVITEHRVLVLACVPESGYRTTAAYLSYRHDDSITVEEILADEEINLVATVKEWEKPHALIVDFTAATEDEVAALEGQLAAASESMDSHSRLIVAVDTKHFALFANSVPGRVFTLVRPDPLMVFAKHLADTTLPISVEQLAANDWISRQLAAAWPPAVSRLALLLKEIAPSTLDSQEKLIEGARDAHSDWAAKLRSVDIGRTPDPARLAQLISAATLEHAAPASVVHAATILLQVSGYAHDELHPLSLAGAVTQLEELSSTSLNPEKVTFGRPGYGVAVLCHLWTEHPWLRPDITKWFIRIPTAVNGLRQEDHERLSDRVAELAARTDPLIAVKLASSWSRLSDKGTPVSLTAESIAVRLLAHTARDRRIGPTIRRTLLHWARTGNIGKQLATIKVCQSGLAEEYPQIVLTRLKHLAGSEDQGVRAGVADALVRLSVHLGVVPLLSALIEWFDNSPPIRYSTLGASLAQVLRERQDFSLFPRRVLITFWERAFDTLKLEDAQALVAAWLDNASRSEQPGRSDAMVEILVSATDKNFHRIAQLIYASRVSVRLHTIADDAVRSLFEQILTRLDEVGYQISSPLTPQWEQR